MMTPEVDTLSIMGMPIAAIDKWQLLDHMFGALEHGEGGWVVTANLDFLRRYVTEPSMRALYGRADILVADGMPLVWAARLQGEGLPERVAGSSLIYLLAERAAREGRSIYLLGGDEGAARGAREEFERLYPSIRIVGHSRPWFSTRPTPAELDPVIDELETLKPDIVLVGLGSPKQEYLIEALRPHLPKAWMIGVGISFSFVAKLVPRAPKLLQRAGLEWAHRLVQDPKRLARRYLVEDLPFAMRLFANALAEGRSRRRTPTQA